MWGKVAAPTQTSTVTFSPSMFMGAARCGT